MSSTDPSAPTHRHALTAVEKQRSNLERLLKDPSKPVYIPPAPQEKTIRPAREMMKNVQGSSAGAGSGEFHVYKASRRREYERLQMMEDATREEQEKAEFERKKREREGVADAKTAKNRAKRQKRKDRSKSKASEKIAETNEQDVPDIPIKKRRLVNGKALVFKKPGDEAESDEEEESASIETSNPVIASPTVEELPQRVTVSEEPPRVIIHDDD